nr:developmental and secondary metabolism regulator mve1 [Quercus suber]
MDRERSERLIKVDNETHSTTSRLTAEGKHLTYQLEVIQQPQRARACGAGAKCTSPLSIQFLCTSLTSSSASADRRPVDPPPIVELKIFSGDVTPENDVTFAMNANYFLFATLEQARPIAQGRVPEDKNRLTVLTGTPVAGMVYLDRPSAAGYFIFPDLSVRHEGKYRLSFSLFEELKNPKDFDKVADASQPSNGGDAHVTHRLEVKSVPFTVFSAKKFPGLAESTSLSRMVAEQGCRVRIRRDVRMRRRDTKPGKDWDEYEDETAPTRERISSTPESMHYASMPGSHGHADQTGRPRSSSNVSHHSLPPLSRRQSANDMNQAYPQPYGAIPMTPQSGYGHSSTHGPPGQQYPQQIPYGQPTQTMQPPSQHQPATYGQPLVSNGTSQSGYYSYMPSPSAASAGQQSQMPQYAPHAVYENNLAPAQRLSIDQSNQHQQSGGHSSLLYGQSHQPATASYQAPAPQLYQPPPPPPPPPLTTRSSLPSLTPSFKSHEYNRAQLAQPSKTAGSTDRNPSENVLPPLRIPDTASSILEPSSPASSAPQNSYFQPAVDTTNKRSYRSVFNDKHLQQRRLDGTRPAAPYSQDSTLTGSQYTAADVDDGASDFDPTMMLRKRMDYRRADGSSAARCLPQSF